LNDTNGCVLSSGCTGVNVVVATGTSTFIVNCASVLFAFTAST
jgi:hypothetical protein